MKAESREPLVLPGRLAAACLLVLGIGLTLTTLLALFLAGEARKRDEMRFEEAVRSTLAAIEGAVHRYEIGLAVFQEFFSNRQVVKPAEWNFQLERMQLAVNYPSLVEAGFGLYLGHDWKLEPPEWIMQRSATRPPPPQTPHPERAGWTPIILHWRAKGWPQVPYGTETDKRDWQKNIPQLAYKLDAPSLSFKKTLTNEAGTSISAATLYLPIYDMGLAEGWAGSGPKNFERRAAMRESSFRGLVFGTIDFNALMAEVFGTSPKQVEFEIFSAQTPKKEEWVNDAKGKLRYGDPAFHPQFSHVLTTHSYSERWSVHFYTTPVFARDSWRNRPWFAVAAGVPASLLLAGITWLQARGRAKAEALAHSLQQSELRMQGLLRDRERMSRDLHDGTIQSLYAVGLGLGRLRKTLGGVPEKGNLDAALEELDRVVGELRGYLVELDPGVSPSQSASKALSELVARLRQTSSAEIRLACQDAVGEGWSSAAILDLLQAAREGVSNALRHGHATKVDLVLKDQGEAGALLVISDNGTGFDPSQARSAGHGLTNLQRRAEAWGGGLALDSRPGGPTQLQLRFKNPAKGPSTTPKEARP